MKKYIITSGVLLITMLTLWYTTFAAIVVVDSYSESNQNTLCISYNATFKGCGQSFTATGVTLDNAVFYIRKTGSPTGNVVAILYAHTGTFGGSGTVTGSALATSDPLDIATLTTSYQLKTFNFTGANRYSLVNGTKYVITLEYTNGNGTNYLNLGVDNTSPTHAGSMAQYLGSWSGVSGQDVIFYVYGDDAVLASASPSTISDIVLFE